MTSAVPVGHVDQAGQENTVVQAALAVHAVPAVQAVHSAAEDKPRKRKVHTDGPRGASGPPVPAVRAVPAVHAVPAVAEDKPRKRKVHTDGPADAPHAPPQRFARPGQAGRAANQAGCAYDQADQADCAPDRGDGAPDQCGDGAADQCGDDAADQCANAASTLVADTCFSTSPLRVGGCGFVDSSVSPTMKRTVRDVAALHCASHWSCFSVANSVLDRTRTVLARSVSS